MSKRQREYESDEESEQQQPSSSKMFKGEGDAKSPFKRRSNERRQNAKFIGICLTCNQYHKCTIGEVSSFAYEHMCYDAEVNADGLDRCIQFLKDQQKLVLRKEQAASVALPKSPGGQQKSFLAKEKAEMQGLPPVPPPPPPPQPPKSSEGQQKLDLAKKQSTSPSSQYNSEA